MRAWPNPDIPSLESAGFGTGPQLALRDTATGDLVVPTTSSPARLYVCGITPYDATHLGHAFTYLTFDILQRAWRDNGLAVTYTQNVTDVDDPLLERADATGVDWQQLAERETELFRSDMTGLRIIAPDHYVGAVESIQLVTAMVQTLSAVGAAYQVDEDWYFDVESDKTFGCVSNLSETDMLVLFAERGGDPHRPGKRNRLDCLLWQSERPGEPAWDSPLGRGRPGWHIECAAIALRYLGADFNVQGGGSDLIFPHHEMSRSESVVATSSEFARAYLHVGMVGYQGEKMSKSKGNLVKVSSLLEAGTDPMVLRVALLTHHYRTDWEWVDSELETAEQRVRNWRSAIGRGATAGADALITQLRDCLADDLDTPGALAAVDQWAASDGEAVDAGPHITLALDALLGVRLDTESAA